MDWGLLYAIFGVVVYAVCGIIVIVSPWMPWAWWKRDIVFSKEGEEQGR